MHKILLPLFCLFSYYFSYAQKEYCQIDTSRSIKINPKEMEAYFANQSFRLEASEPDAIPVRIHVVVNSAGQKADSTTILNALAEANTHFAGLNVKFFLCEKINYIVSDRFYSIDDYYEENDMLTANNGPNTVDVFYVNNVTYKSACGYASVGWNSDGYVVMICNDAPVLIHELGHYFNLMHTHEDVYGKELVNGSNCSTAGDNICDTPADPNVYLWTDSNCKYYGTDKDINGQTYTPPVDNHMSYAPGWCRKKFTAQQLQRMRYYYEQVAKNALFCSDKLDFSVRLWLKNNALSKTQSNSVRFVIQNNSVVNYTGPLEYEILLKPYQGVAVKIYSSNITNKFVMLSSDTIDATVTVPNTIADGTYDLILNLDPANKILEGFETNNSDKAQIGIFPNGMFLPDLVSMLKGNTTHESGTKFVATGAITNTGNLATKDCIFSYFVSEDTILDISDKRFGAYSLPALAAGQSYPLSLDISLPKDLEKAYYILLLADSRNEIDEVSEKNNVASILAKNIPPTENVKKPDLVISAHHFSPSTPASLNVLEQPYLQFTVDNLAAYTSAPSLTGIFVSKDATFSDDDLFIYETPDPYAQFRVPLSVPSGDYYIILKADHADYIYETNELNNTHSFPMKIVNVPTPDLAIQSVSIQDYVWEKGKNYNVGIECKNIGTAVCDSWYYNIYIEKEKYIYADATFKYLVTEYFNSFIRDDMPVGVNARYKIDQSISASTNFEEGYYYVAACTNNGMVNGMFKDWEQNNCMIVDKPILIVEKKIITETEDYGLLTGCKIFPNPTENYATVLAASKITNFNLFTLEGNVVLSLQNTSTLDLSTLRPGIYLAKILTEDGSSYHQKLMIDRK